ncbi:MAG: hypothetical protein ACTHMT_12560 [Verrucomicrobiota bacterium]
MENKQRRKVAEGKNLHVRPHTKKGGVLTSFDIFLWDHLHSFHLVGDVIDRLANLGSLVAYANGGIRDWKRSAK